MRGLRSGDVGGSARNVVPRSAEASLDLRLPAGVCPVLRIEAIREHVAARGFHLVDEAPDAATREQHRRIARVRGSASYPGVQTDPDHPAAVPVLGAVEAAAGEAPIVVPSFGSSVPLHHFQTLGAPALIVPMANHDNNQHAPDENLKVANLWYGIDLVAALLG